MSDITTPIEKGVPIPPITRPGRTAKYPVAYLDVGESFFIPKGNTNSIQSAVRRHEESEDGKGKSFTVRSMKSIVPGEEDKGEQDGIRVWRTA